MLPFLVLLLAASVVRTSPVEPQTVIVQPLAEEAPREARAYDNEVNQKQIFTPANEESLMTKLNAKCSQRDASSCLMLKLVTYMNRLLKKSSIGVGDSLVITQTSAVVEEESPLSRGFQDDSDESQIGHLIANKLWTFVRSRSIKWSVLPEADLLVSATPDDEGTLQLGLNIRAAKALETGRGKMKNAGPLIAAGMMKIGMIGVLAFKALALLVGKALLVSKLAFLLAAVIGLKKLLSQERHVTYEVVAHPHHSHSEVHSSGHHDAGGYGSSGWGRSIGLGPQPIDSTDPQTLAYSAHAP